MKKYILTPIIQENKTDDASNGISVEDIVQCLPKSIKNKAKVLLDHLIRNQAVHWNDKGEISILEGANITGSHIVDLVKCSLLPYKSFIPAGYDQFQLALQETNIPKSILIQRGSGFPPPGQPVTKKNRTLSEDRWQWHKM